MPSSVGPQHHWQISVKAAPDRGTGSPRCQESMSPADILQIKVDDMRAAGLSARKVEYLVDLSIHFDTGAVHERLGCDGSKRSLPGLIAIRGIGRWTMRCSDLLFDAVTCCRWMMSG
jgi:DNA-3-methyladenine glycosylase II